MFYFKYIFFLLNNFNIFYFLLFYFFCTIVEIFAQNSFSQFSLLNSNTQKKEKCQSNVCFNGGICFIKLNSEGIREFECECRNNFIGDLCQSKCSINCQNGGKCKRNNNINENNNFNNDFCECLKGYKGLKCEEDINECFDNNKEEDICKNGGICINNFGSFECKCSSKFNGQFCDIPILNNNKTINNNINNNYCPYPFVLFKNESSGEDECICVKSRNIKEQKEGINDNLCELKESKCNNKNELLEKCQNGGECVQLGLKAFCICPNEFTGKYCEHLIIKNNKTREEKEEKEKECLVKGKKCLNGGKCIKLINYLNNKNEETFCECTDKYNGLWCDRPLRLTFEQIFKEKQNLIETTEKNESSNIKNLITKKDEEENNQTKLLISSTEQQKQFFVKLQKEEEKEDEHFKNNLINNNTQQLNNFNIFLDYLNNTSEFVNNCRECSSNTTIKCLLINKEKAKCLCLINYFGSNCKIKKESCSFKNNCSNNYLNNKINLLNSSTILGFNNLSLLLIQQKNNKRKFNLKFNFCTTLSNIHLISTENLLGELLFSFGLENGNLFIKLNNENNNTKLINNNNNFSLKLNDADWYTVIIWSNNEGIIGYELIHFKSSNLLFRQILEINNLLFSNIWNIRFGRLKRNSDYFVGCMSDVILNGETLNADYEGSFNISPICIRKDQCQKEENNNKNNNKCLNNGRCIDLWDNYICQCLKPYLPPNCTQKINQITFGYNNIPSFALVIYFI